MTPDMENPTWILAIMAGASIAIMIVIAAVSERRGRR